MKILKLYVQNASSRIPSGKGYLFMILMLVMILTNVSLFAETSNKIPKQTVSISGIVTDNSGIPIPGVNIVIKGTTDGTITDVDGKYELQIPSKDAILIFSSIGYQSREIAVDGRTTINVKLTEEVTEIEEIVVIGYGTVKKSDLTGAISKVTSEELTKIPAKDFSGAIQGKAPGVMVMQTGEPGGKVNIKVRGIGSINRGSNPLYVIDGFVGADINNISPYDIESIQVLKDASAAAIYGTNGSNGVIIINTKRGQKGKQKVTFSSFGRINRSPKKFDLMDADQYADFYNNLLIEDGQEPELAYTDEFRQWYYGEGWEKGTDWQDEILQQSYAQNYHLSVSGGSQNNNFSISSGYYDEKGILIGTGAQRITLRANADFNIGKYIKIGETINLSQSVRQNSDFGGQYGALNDVLIASPLMKVYNKENKEGYEGPQISYDHPELGVVKNTGGNDKINPRAKIEIGDKQIKTKDITASIYLEIMPFEWLSYKITPSVGIINVYSNDWTPSYDLGVRTDPSARLIEGYNENTVLSLENQLTVNQSFGKHNFILTGVNHAREGNSKGLNAIGTNFNYEQLNTISNSERESRNISGGFWPWATNSYLARLIYSYDSKYMLTASIRRDGSSNFGPDNRWGNFPAFSVAWKINEDFLTNIDEIDVLKVRLGWGRTGNSNIGAFKYQSLLAGYSQFNPVLGKDQTVVPALNELKSIGNPLIKWESAEMTNIGLDFTAWDGKFDFSAEYYIKKQDDLLVQINVTRTTGKLEEGRPWMNIGKVENTGVEFNSSYKGKIGPVYYSLMGNLTTFKNEVIDIPESYIEEYNITRVGSAIGSLYGFVVEGIVTENDFDDEGNYIYAGSLKPGDLKFKDLNRDGSITDDDRTIIGKTIPDFSYSLNLNLIYKLFDFSVFFFGMEGMDAFNNARRKMESFSSQDLHNNKLAAFASNAWTSENPSEEYIRADLYNSNQNDRISTWWIEDASFLRIKDIQLGYTLPIHLLRKISLDNLRIYFSAMNLVTFTKYSGRDPESAFGANDNNSSLIMGVDDATYPIPRSFSAGFQLSF